MAGKKAKLGRVPDITPEICDKICEDIANGSNLHKVTSDETMPSRTAVYSWLNKGERWQEGDDEIYLTFLNNYVRARRDRADWRADRIDQFGELLLNGEIDAQTYRAIVDTEKWQAGKENSSRYGEKVTNEITGANGGPIKTQAITFEPFSDE